MTKFRHVNKKQGIEIQHEWDALAPIRFEQISSGKDLTFNHVLSPEILKLADEIGANSVVDAGCGVGILTGMLADRGYDVTGVDPSGENIKIARARFGGVATFIESSLEDFSQRNFGAFDMIIANMVLMDVPDLRAFLSAVSAVLRDGGAFIFSIAHPCFWPSYYGYDEEEWFNYKGEFFVESPFRISSQENGDLVSTHVHRPIEAYVEAFLAARLQILHLREPLPTAEVQELYPRPWKSPRYLVGSCRRSS